MIHGYNEAIRRWVSFCTAKCKLTHCFTAAVKLLLDMGSDINAQIETNRNTALTLACFQGRHEVVSLLLDRKANVEHRAKVMHDRIRFQRYLRLLGSRIVCPFFDESYHPGALTDA